MSNVTKFFLCLAVVAWVGLCISPTVAYAQIDELKKYVGLQRRASTEFVPGSACLVAAAFPKQLSDDPKFDLFPREIVSAWGIKEYGFDPMLINQITLVVKTPEQLTPDLQWVAVLHFDELQGLSGSLIDELDEKIIANKTVYSRAEQGLPSFLIFDEATMFVGSEEFFAEMVESDRSGPLVQTVGGSAVSGQIQAFADLESLRPVLNQLAQMLPKFLPPAITKLKRVPDLVDAIEIGVEVESGATTTLVIHCIDDDSALETNDILVNALDFGIEMLVGSVASQMDFSDPVQEATVEYVQRIARDYQQELQPVVTGDTLTMELDEAVTLAPILVGLALPTAQQTRTAARRTQSMNNLRQTTLALHNYESANGSFPAQATYDKNGKPLLSWRVQILPFIEQQELYDQFHHDEPWDSPHNKKLIEKMPLVFQSPAVGNLKGKTTYLGIAGEGAFFGKDGRTFADITDGTSNTVLAIEVNANQAVEWTKPQDYQPDPDKPLDGLGGTFPGGFVATFADGSTRFISNNVDIEAWKALLTIGGGEIPGDLDQ